MQIVSTVFSLIVLDPNVYQVYIRSTLFPLQAPQLKPPDSIDLAHNPSLSAALPQLTSVPDANRKAVAAQTFIRSQRGRLQLSQAVVTYDG